MKRNSVTKKILSLVMCLLMAVSIVPIGMISASAATLGNWTYSNLPIQHSTIINWKNGKKTVFIDEAKNRLVLHYVKDSISSKLAYCVIPGVEVSSNSPGSFDSFDNDAFVNATNGELSKIQIDNFVKLVVAYGYPTGGSRPSGDNFYNAYATQLLIWEIVTGERNSNFSHNGDKYYALELVKTAKGDYCDNFTTPYNNIVDNVLEDLKNRNKKDETENLKEKYTDLGTVELERVQRDGIFFYEGEFVNEDIKNCTISSLNELPSQYLSIDNNSGTMKVSIPLNEAFAYQNDNYEGVLTKTETSKTTQIVEYKDLSNISTTIYKGSQQMVVLEKRDQSRPDKVSKTVTKTTNQPYRLSFAIKVPEVHRHNWIPHRINPTCTTQGLMCWECSCGRVVTADYGFVSGSGPKDFNYKDGIVPAEGHDHGVTVTTIEPTCESKGEEQTLCTKCGIIIGSKEIPALGHTKEGEGSVWVVSQEPTAEAKGEMSLLCGKCGAVQKTKEIEQHTHDNKGGEVVITAPSCATDGMKGTLCSACGAVYDTKTIAASHSDTTVEVTNVAATCTKDGEANVLCTTCGDILSTKVLPALGHTDDDVWFTAVEPTCTADGEVRKLCTRCGEVTDAKAADALGHDDGVWTTTIEPTCELDGEQVLNCTRCGKMEDSKTIAKLGHDNGAWRIDIEATADHDGSMNLYCTRCSMVQDTKTFGQHKHEKGYTKTLLQATCTRNGEQGTVCAICDAIYETKEIAAAGHSYLAPYQNGNGTHSMKCENCGYAYTQNCSLVNTVYANSCTTIGYSVHVCTLCGYNYTDGYTEAMGHDYAKWENYNASSHVRYCSRCPVAEYTLHVWSPYYFNGDETVTASGTKTRVCIYCGTEHTIEGEDSGITAAVDTTINVLEFSLKLIEFANKVIVAVEKFLSVIFSFIR